jgi:hypothetical protein
MGHSPKPTSRGSALRPPGRSHGQARRHSPQSGTDGPDGRRLGHGRAHRASPSGRARLNRRTDTNRCFGGAIDARRSVGVGPDDSHVMSSAAWVSTCVACRLRHRLGDHNEGTPSGAGTSSATAHSADSEAFA